MQGDLPHTLFSHKASDGDPKKQTVASDEVIRLQEEANRRIAERKAAKEKENNLHDLNELIKK